MEIGEKGWVKANSTWERRWKHLVSITSSVHHSSWQHKQVVFFFKLKKKLCYEREFDLSPTFWKCFFFMKSIYGGPESSIHCSTASYSATQKYTQRAHKVMNLARIYLHGCWCICTVPVSVLLHVVLLFGNSVFVCLVLFCLEYMQYTVYAVKLIKLFYECTCDLSICMCVLTR